MPNYFVTEPMVLVLREKHDNRYFLVRDDADLNRAALHILRQRYEEGYYEDPVRSDYVNEDAEQMVREWDAAQADGSAQRWPQAIQSAAQRVYEDAKRQMQEADRADLSYRIEAQWHRQLERILALPSEEALARVNTAGRPLCYLMLLNHSRGEYEGLDLEPFESVEG